MAESETIREKYFRQTLDVLSKTPPVLLAFRRSWEEGKFRQAYLTADETIRAKNIVVPDAYRKVDEAFYWEFIN